MSNTRATSQPTNSTSRRPSIVWAHIRVCLPKTICRVCKHPLLRPDDIDSLIHNSSDLALENIRLVDLGSLEMKQLRVSLPQSVVAKFNRVSAARNCSRQVLINSALAEWLDDSWYRGGQPKPFLEICKKIGIDLLMTSNDPETLQCYYAGVFGSPDVVGDTSFWADPPFAWATKMRKRYEHY